VCAILEKRTKDFWAQRDFEKPKDDGIVENAKTFAKEVRENGLLLLSAQDG
jgi:hypothetical protein